MIALALPIEAALIDRTDGLFVVEPLRICPLPYDAAHDLPHWDGIADDGREADHIHAHAFAKGAQRNHG